jgi:hypothetical protein
MKKEKTKKTAVGDLFLGTKYYIRDLDSLMYFGSFRFSSAKGPKLEPALEEKKTP